uniref:CASP-like protein n=1 Tax=Ascaris lumbricoides TaxID=6252 RepID=A0A0M3ITZ5_ASCLU
MDQNFSPGAVKFVELTCALRALGVVVDEHEMPLLTDLCINKPGSKFCPPYTFCHQSMRYNYSFCCGRGLPNSKFIAAFPLKHSHNLGDITSMYALL